MSSHLSIQNLSKAFQSEKGEVIRAVQDVSLDVGDDEILALVGPSGCGKTTLLRLIAGLEKADEGSIFFKSLNITTSRPADRDVAMVFQGPALLPHLSVTQNISLGLKLRQVEQKKVREETQRIAEEIGIVHLLNRNPSELSVGESQRVVLARAAVRNPAILLLDEPLANLDPAAREQLRPVIRRLRRSSKAIIIYVTHDQSEALALGDRIAFLESGKLLQLAEPKEIYENPKHLRVAQFFGWPGINTFPAVIKIMGERAEVGIEDEERGFISLGFCKFAANPGDHFIGAIRPEAIQVNPLHGQMAQVERCDFQGHEWHIHSRLGARSFVFRSQNSFPNGSKLKIIFKTFHLFDSRTLLWAGEAGDEKASDNPPRS